MARLSSTTVYGDINISKDIDVSGLSTFSGDVTLGSDLVANNGETIWDESATYIPQGRLQNDTVTIEGNSVSLGGSTSVNHNDLSSISSDDHHTKYTDSNAISAVEGATFNELAFNNIEDPGTNRSIGIDDSEGVLFKDSGGSTYPLWNSKYVSGGTDVSISGGDGAASTPITISHDNTSGQGNVSAGAGEAITDINLDGRGHTTSISTTSFDSRYDNYGHWGLEDDDGNNTSINSGDDVRIDSGTDITTNISSTGGYTEIDISHAGTSSQGNVFTSGATVIDDIGLDGRGHVTNLNTQNRSLDDWNDANNSINLSSNNINSVGSLNVSEITSNNGNDPVRIDQSFEFQDDIENYYGNNSDFSVKYESSSDELVIRDETNGVDLIRQPKQGSTQFIQGADIGSIEAPEDSLTQIINAPITSSSTSGDVVGYTFSIDNQTAMALEAQSDGSGGISGNPGIRFEGNISLQDNTVLDVTGITTNSDDFFILSSGSGTGAVNISDGSQAIANFNDGGNVDIPNGSLSVSDPSGSSFVSEGGDTMSGKLTIDNTAGNRRIQLTGTSGDIPLIASVIDGAKQGWIGFDDSSSQWRFYDDVNGQSIFQANIGGNVEIPNGDTLLGGNTLQEVGGTTDATEGDIRLGNGTSIFARGVNNNTDFGIEFTSTGTIEFLSKGGTVTTSKFKIADNDNVIIPNGNLSVNIGRLNLSNSLTTGQADLYLNSDDRATITMATSGIGEEFQVLNSDDTTIEFSVSASGQVSIPDGDLSLSGNVISSSAIALRSDAGTFVDFNFDDSGGNRFGVRGGSANTEYLSVFDDGNVEIQKGRLTANGLDSSPLFVETATVNSGSDISTSQTWAGEIHNRADASGYGGLVVSNRWANNDTDVLTVGSNYDNGNGFDKFFTVTGAGEVNVLDGGLNIFGNGGGFPALQWGTNSTTEWGAQYDEGQDRIKMRQLGVGDSFTFEDAGHVRIPQSNGESLIDKGGSAERYKSATIADDGVASFSNVNAMEMVIVNDNNTQRADFFTTGYNTVRKFTSGQLVQGTDGTAPTGTTGTDGQITVFRNSNVTYVENRSGNSISVKHIAFEA